MSGAFLTPRSSSGTACWHRFELDRLQKADASLALTRLARTVDQGDGVVGGLAPSELTR